MRIEKIDANNALLALLENSGLLASDIGSEGAIDFFGVIVDNELHASIGLQVLSDGALIRSLAVTAQSQGQGYARKLVEHVEESAKSNGITGLYLLTDTASGLFEKLGYQHLSRANAPEAVQTTAQFTSLCPDSCSILYKNI